MSCQLKKQVIGQIRNSACGDVLSQREEDRPKQGWMNDGSAETDVPDSHT